MLLLSWSVDPAGQMNIEQAPIEPPGTYDPAGHVTQGVVGSKSSSVEPAGQAKVEQRPNLAVVPR